MQPQCINESMSSFLLISRIMKKVLSGTLFLLNISTALKELIIIFLFVIMACFHRLRLIYFAFLFSFFFVFFFCSRYHAQKFYCTGWIVSDLVETLNTCFIMMRVILC